MKNLTASIPLLVMFFSCTPTSEKLNRVWFYISTETVPKNKSAKGKIPADLNSLCFLNLQPNGKYTAYLSDFEYGRWVVNEENELILENNHKQQRILPIQKLDKEEFVFTVEDRQYHFEGFQNSFTHQDDPFSKENNWWRIKADHKETDKEITERLKNHFRFWEKYFSWALKTEKEILNVRSLPSPLKLYSNGFVVIPYQDQSPKWAANFYDSTDSRIAYEKVNYLFVHGDIDWPTTNNRFKLFISAFQQLQKKIK